MADIPGTPEEKLHAFRMNHFATGTEFDEAKIRQVLGLPSVEHPELLAAAPEIQRLVLMEDREATRDLAAAQEKQNRELAALEEKNQQMRSLQESNEQLKAQVAELMAERGSAPVSKPSMPSAPMASAKKEAHTLPADSVPNTAWPIQQIVQWMDEKGYALPPKKGFGMSKNAVLDFALEQHKKNGEAA